MKSTIELSKLLELEKIDVNIYRGQNYQSPWGRVYGGQVMAQAVHAARRTVVEDRLVHSLHGYFILWGDLSKPIVFDVDRIRDGKSFTTRRVVALQDGKAIFNLSASFQISEGGFQHQLSMPEVPAPETLMSNEEWVDKYKDMIPESQQKALTERPFEFRSVERSSPSDLCNKEPVRHIWIKARDLVSNDQALQREMLTYASDYNLMSTSMLPHRAKFEQKDLQAASLDHAMWFYENVNVNEWLLFTTDSPVAGSSRGLSRGNFFTRDGKLVAAVVQEGLIRHRLPNQKTNAV